jgi:hypothetical protein
MPGGLQAPGPGLTRREARRARGRDGHEEGTTVKGEASTNRPTWWHQLTPTERQREIEELEALLRLARPAAEQQAA